MSFFEEVYGVALSCIPWDISLWFQLGSRRSAREELRRRGTYLILREYHKWEKQEDLRDRCEDVIQLLIRFESTSGMILIVITSKPDMIYCK